MMLKFLALSSKGLTGLRCLVVVCVASTREITGSNLAECELLGTLSLCEETPLKNNKIRKEQKDTTIKGHPYHQFVQFRQELMKCYLIDQSDHRSINRSLNLIFFRRFPDRGSFRRQITVHAKSAGRPNYYKAHRQCTGS